MEKNQIIENLKSQLTDDNQHNINLLKNELGKYRNQNDIYSKIKNMIFENFPQDIQDKFKDCIKNVFKTSEDGLEKAVNFIKEKDYVNAKKELDFLVELMNVYQDMVECKCLCFNNVVDFIIFVNKTKPNYAVEWTSINISYVYYLLGFIAIEENNLSLADDYFDKSVEYNPMSVRALFEKAEICKISKNYENFFNIVEQIYEKIYSPSDLARYYRLLAYYHVENHNYKLAYAINLLSLRFELNQSALYELEYIKMINQEEIEQIKGDDLFNILDEANIHPMISEENAKFINSFVQDKNNAEKFPNEFDKILKYIDIFINGVKTEEPIKSTND